MAGKQATGHAIEGLGARLIIAGILDELRADPESFARLLVAVAQIRQADAAEVARLFVRAEDELSVSARTGADGATVRPGLTR